MAAQDGGGGGGLVHLPQPGRPVLTPGGQGATIRAEGQRIDWPLVATEWHATDHGEYITERLVCR